jgi:hypothetical protein
MHRDPFSYADDVATLASIIAELLPEHYWPLTETSGTSGADSGFTNKTVTFAGTPTRNVASGFGFVLTRFDGSDDVGSIAATPTASTTTFSMLAFIRPLQAPTDDLGMILGDSNGVGFHFFVTGNMARLPGWVRGSSENVYPTDAPVLSWREPHLVAVRVVEGVCEFFIDGVLYSDVTIEGGFTTINAVTPDRIGSQNGSARRFKGDIGQVVYLPGVAITDEQLGRIWAARYPCNTATLHVVNAALQHLGDNNAITNLSTDATPRGVAFRQHWATAVESVLRDYAWPFAKRYATLALIGGTSTDAFNSDWQYVYRAPTRMVRALRVLEADQKDGHNPTPHPFEVGQDEAGPVIYTDLVDAELEYTTRPYCPASQGDVFFREALQWYLAALFAPTLSKNERTVADCLQMYRVKLGIGAASSANEEVPQDTNRNDPSWIRDR